MRDKYFYEVMFDDTSIDVSKEVGLVWSIANSLRGAYTSDKYKDVIIPMVIIRRFECALEATKDAVVAKHKQNPNLPAALLCQVSKYPFYNYSEYTLKRLLDDSDSIASNLKSYIEGFSANIQLILEKLLKFSTQIDKMDKSNRLYSVVKKFSDLDLYPAHVDSMKMGYIFEDIIRRFSENAEAGDHYTPREVIRLMVNVLLAEGCNDLLTDEGKEIEVGSGGNDFDIADKITASNFRQKKTGENTHEIESKPEVSLPTPNEVFMDEAVKKKLSEIIDEINAAYNKNFDVDVASKSALQMRDILLKNGHLRDSARNNSLKDFRFAYFDAVQDALIAGYEQNQDFFALLLDNDEKKRELMQVFLEDVYRNLRT